jgi:hypothetical protein
MNNACVGDFSLNNLLMVFLVKYMFTHVNIWHTNFLNENIRRLLQNKVDYLLCHITIFCKVLCINMP